MASKSAKVAVALGIAMAVTVLAAPAEGYYGMSTNPIGVLTYRYGETQNAKDMKARTC